MHLFSLAKSILNSYDKIHAYKNQNSSYLRALRAVFRIRQKKGEKCSGRGQRWTGTGGSLEEAQAEVAGEGRLARDDADSAAVYMAASQAMLLISHSGTSVHVKHQL